MTSTDVEASSRPQTAGTEVRRRGSSRAARRLMVLPVALLLALAFAAPSFATSAQPLSGYGGQSTPAPKPSSGTSPSKSTKTPTSKTPTTSTPANEPAPATSSSVPTTTTAPAKSSSLPFTGFNLSWTVGGGLLLIAMGFSIVTVQRRQGRDSGR
jgi:hypothetical protein